MNVLRFYMPKLAHDNLSQMGLGMGVFTIQGYERRKKELKNTLHRFNNRKYNLVISNMRQL